VFSGCSVGVLLVGETSLGFGVSKSFTGFVMAFDCAEITGEATTSLAGVIVPDASLLDGPEGPVELSPLAACAYENAGAGAGALIDAFSVD